MMDASESKTEHSDAVYELKPDPFYTNPDTHVSLFLGRRLSDRFLVISKRHDFSIINDQTTQNRMIRCLNAALHQAKLQHPNICDVLEVGLEINKSNCSIHHVLEALESDLGKDIKKRTGHPYSEMELRDVAIQTATALAFAHSKKVAHRDVKPSNIFRTGATYKLGDFGCFFLKRGDKSYTKSYAGDQRYMSPQLLVACVQGSEYNAFKTDVFALGATLLHVATGKSPEPLLQSVDGVRDSLQGISSEMRDLICRMMAREENQRPTMQEVCMILNQSTANSQVPVNYQTPQRTQSPLIPQESGRRPRATSGRTNASSVQQESYLTSPPDFTEQRPMTSINPMRAPVQSSQSSVSTRQAPGRASVPAVTQAQEDVFERSRLPTARQATPKQEPVWNTPPAVILEEAPVAVSRRVAASPFDSTEQRPKMSINPMRASFQSSQSSISTQQVPGRASLPAVMQAQEGVFGRSRLGAVSSIAPKQESIWSTPPAVYLEEMQAAELPRHGAVPASTTSMHQTRPQTMQSSTSRAREPIRTSQLNPTFQGVTSPTSRFPEPNGQLVHVKKESIRYFNFHTNTWRYVNLQQEIQADTDSTWLVLEDDRVFICGGFGGFSEVKSAYVLTREGLIVSRSEMRTGRGCHGVIAFRRRNAVHVFGGKSYFRNK